jgi:hypothetical protein
VDAPGFFIHPPFSLSKRRFESLVRVLQYRRCKCPGSVRISITTNRIHRKSLILSVTPAARRMQLLRWESKPLNRTYIFAAAMLAAFSMSAPSMHADDHSGAHNTGQHVRREVRYDDHRADRERELRLRHERDERVRHEREERTRHEREARLHRDHHVERHDFRDHRNDHDRREGWQKGQKRGWHGENLPPGQAKKADGR